MKVTYLFLFYQSQLQPNGHSFPIWLSSKCTSRKSWVHVNATQCLSFGWCVWLIAEYRWYEEWQQGLNLGQTVQYLPNMEVHSLGAERCCWRVVGWRLDWRPVVCCLCSLNRKAQLHWHGPFGIYMKIRLTTVNALHIVSAHSSKCVMQCLDLTLCFA